MLAALAINQTPKPKVLEHHPLSAWGALHNEEPDWGTAISEPFVIFPTGQNLIQATSPAPQQCALSSTERAQLRGCGGDE